MNLFKRNSSRSAPQKQQAPSRRLPLLVAAPTVPPPMTIANSTLDLHTSSSSLVLDDNNITPLPSSSESQHHKPAIGRKILNDQNANGSRRSTSSRSHASQSNCDQPSFSQPNVVTPTSKDANDRMYLQNTLNTFTFGAALSSSFSSRSVDPLSRPREETDPDELIYKADTTPRPSVVGPYPFRSHPSQSHSAAGGAQRPLPAHPPSSARAAARRDRSQTKDTDTASCHTFGTSSASASVSSLSSASGLNSLASSQISEQSNNTPQTSTNELTSDDDIDHRHPLPPTFVDDVPSRRFGAESSTYLSEEDFDDDSDFDQDDKEIYVGSVNEGSDYASYFDHVSPSRESLHDSIRMAYGERRGSLAIATSGMPSNRFHVQGRYREDSTTTLRRPSKSLEYLRSSNMGEPSHPTEEFLAPTSVPESEGDWRDLRKKSLQRDKDPVLPLVTASPMAAGITVACPSHTPASGNNSAVSGLDTSWNNWAGGITGFDQSEMNDIIAPMPAGRRPSDRVFGRGSTTGERRGSTVSCNSGDFFHKTLARNWGGEGYKNQQQKWTFQREKADRLQSEDEPRMRGDRERHSISNLFSPRPSTAPTTTAGIFDRHDSRDKAREQYWKGMAVDAEEWWFSHTNGRYKVNRKNAQAVESGKAPQQRLNITHHRTPYTNQRDLADGPIASIHKHSKAVAFSISRHYRLRPTATPKTTTSSLRPPTTSRMPSTPTNVDANRKKSTSMILLGPRRVQEAYTSTTTTRKLESHGLLDESGRTSPRDLERMKRERDRERKAKEKGKKKETEEAKKSRSNKFKSARPKQEFSSESSVGSAGGAISSGGSFTLVSGPSRIVDSSPASNIAYVAASTSHSIMTQETTSSDRTVSHTRYRRHVGDDEDDDDLFTGIKRPTRTPHQEAYDTIIPDGFEPTSSQENVFGSLFGWRKQRNAPSSRAQAIRGSYKPPWAVAPSRHNSEVRKGIVDDLNTSFQDVGLLPALHEIKGTNHGSQKRKREQQSSKNSRRLTSDAAQADIFEDIPTDSLYMLLPLWPGETDAKSAQKYPYTMPTISTDSRQYLLIYYKVPLQTSAEQEQQKLKSQTGGKNSKRARNSPTSSHDSAKNRDHVLLTTFHISARVVAYHDLQGSGVRIPDQGLAVQGPLADAYGSMPTSIRDQGLVDWVIGVCHSREAGIEFLPESLEKMGLCRSLPNSPALPTHDLRDEEDEEVESDLVMTPIGRAVIEMAWLGGMALTSFGPGI